MITACVANVRTHQTAIVLRRLASDAVVPHARKKRLTGIHVQYELRSQRYRPTHANWLDI